MRFTDGVTTGWAAARLALIAALQLGESRAVTTITFTGTFVDRPTTTNTIVYNYNAGIQSEVNNVGNVLNFAATAPASSQANWYDPQGSPIQGDGRYADRTRSNGPFTLGVTYYTSPNHLTMTPVGTVHFTNGVADNAWLGQDSRGLTGSTGIWAAGKLAKLDERRMDEIGDPIQIGSGTATAERTLFSLYGARNWVFSIAYNSALAAAQDSPGALGFGWAHPYEVRVVPTGTGLVLQWTAARSNTFVPKTDDPNSFTSSEDATRYDVLVAQPGGGWLLTRRDQSKLLFNSSGLLVEDRDSHGRKLVLAYDGSGRIATITDSISATKLTFDYVFGTQRVNSITDAMGGVVTFGYTAGQVLNRIVNQNGKAVSFTYNANHGLLTVVDHEGAVVSSNTFDASGRVVLQEDGVAGNQPLSLGFAEQGLPGNTLYAGSDTAMTTPLPLPIADQFRITSFAGLDGRTISYTYDPSGRLSTAVANGQTTTVNYDGAGAVASVTDPLGQSIPVAPEIVVGVNDRTGRTSTYRFDPNFNLRSFENALGEKTAYVYDSQNNLSRVTDALGRTTGFTYDTAGNLLTMTDPTGQVTTHTYDARNNLLTTTDPLGHMTTRTYDASNNPVSLTDAQGSTTKWTYDANSLPLTMTLPRGGMFQYSYAAGRIVQVTDPTGVITRFGYDADGRMVYREDALGKRTAYIYDPIGNVVSVTDPLTATTAYVYDHRNRLRSVTDPVGAVTRYLYDGNGNLISITDALGHVAHFAYDGEDRLTTVTDPSGRTSLRSYDAAGRVIGLTDGTGAMTKFEYDTTGAQIVVVDALGRRTTSSRDARGLVASVTDPLGRCTTFDYDALGARVGSKDPLGRQTTWSRDLLGRLGKVTDPNSLTAAQECDADGNIVTLTNALLAVTELSRDAAGRLTSVRTPEGRKSSYTYDPRGLLATIAEPSAQSATFGYDDAGRVTAMTDAVGTITQTRDAAGRVLTVSEGGKTLQRTYDQMGRLASYTDGDGNVIGYTYDEAGRLAELTYPDGRKVSYGYDLAGRLNGVTDWAGRVTAYVYDAAGRVTEVRRPNGTRQVRTYDAAGQMTELRDMGADGTTPIFARNLGHNAGGELTREEFIPAVDAPGTPLMQTFDRDNRLLSHNGAATVLDADGNLLSIEAGVTPASYEYDVRNRLIRAGDHSYTYDPENRRIAVAGANGTTRFAINPNSSLDQVLVRTLADGTRTTYVYGLGLLHEETGTAVRYYHGDRRGDTVALTDAAGVVTDRMSYGPYGEPFSRSGSSDTPFLFSGLWGVQTDGNGLYYHRARYYHPTLRRFLSQDSIVGSIVQPMTLNRYAYTSGNPVNSIDPTGFYDQDVHHDLTYSLAVRVGFSRDAAETIAAANQGLDDTVRSGPYVLPAARRDFHFTTPERREQMLQDAKDTKGLEQFGWYLHAEQDSFAHQRGQTDRDGEPYGYLMGHVLPGHGIDQTYMRPELAVHMAEDTYQQLRRFYQETTGKSSCDDWANIRPVVDHWVKIEK